LQTNETLGHKDPIMSWQHVFRRRAPTNETLTGVEARAGFLDRPVLAVLMVSLVLIVAAFGAILLGFW
jgi:hypothetical protein